MTTYQKNLSNQIKLKINKPAFPINIFLLFFVIFLYGNLAYGKNNQNFIFSNGRNLISASFANEKIEKQTPVFDANKWSHVVWPTYDSNTNTLFVEALDSESLNRFIVQASFNNGKISGIKKIIKDGRMPKLSPNGAVLAFYNHPHQLSLYNLKPKEEFNLSNDLNDRYPVVWLSNDEVMYKSKFKRIVILNIKTKEKRYLDSPLENDFYPYCLSVDSKFVYGGSFDGNKIYSYSLSENKINLIKKYKVVGGITNIIANEKGFVFTKQRVRDLFLLKDLPRLFYYDFKDESEVEISSPTRLFGGFFE